MATKKGISFIIPLVVYPFDIMVSVGQTDMDFLFSLKEYLPPGSHLDLDSEDESLLNFHPSMEGRTVNYSKTLQTVMRVRNYPTNPRGYGIIAHEIFHAVSYILWRMNINLEIEKTDEVYAYLTDYITTEFYKNINSKK